MLPVDLVRKHREVACSKEIERYFYFLDEPIKWNKNNKILVESLLFLHKLVLGSVLGMEQEIFLHKVFYFILFYFLLRSYCSCLKLREFFMQQRKLFEPLCII